MRLSICSCYKNGFLVIVIRQMLVCHRVQRFSKLEAIFSSSSCKSFYASMVWIPATVKSHLSYSFFRTSFGNGFTNFLCNLLLQQILKSVLNACMRNWIETQISFQCGFAHRYTNYKSCNKQFSISNCSIFTF